MVIFGKLLYTIVLLLNAICVLSEDRFLARVNLTPATHDHAFGDRRDGGVRLRTINLIASIRTLLRMPLIVINIVIIVFEIVLG
ncbi:hypothetical protein S7711_11235 [Stachybotrys chartarum IBT 7711]|uniref:Yos1-like protein n=1 Tax=Stachybotrys chartarum (strain CBS 109288 / IBT 7711) TaxID=1280523 RepID=A0A084AIP1_STACB|nr:hypothetical protein S7711_11235 [Stachybotrys chartarum IBT 7711]KFA48463.1 hypothetical protein S40293_10372 [Stachybotrys chartarum IBT 40293]KFA74844.1 hypothetical protein S40288_10812 [Stachybotrys chartarum IBT 40288]